MDTKFLIEEVSQTMLTQESAMPMLYLELDDNSVHMFALDILDDTQSIPAQCGILARLGWEKCKKHPGCKPMAAAYTGEAWRVSNPGSNEERMMPVNSKKRQEILTVQIWQASQKPQGQSYSLPVIRDHKKRVTDIGEAEGPIANISHQLASFVHGCMDAQKPDDEVFGKMDETIRKRVASMPPHLQDELRNWLQREGIDPNEYLDKQ